MIKHLLEENQPEEPEKAKDSGFVSLFDDEKDKHEEVPYVISRGEPTGTPESIRQSGLAYSAGIALFASVAFMLIIGWGADLLFGSSPWGIVAGIVFGALIGFIQFFRITSQIFKK